MLLGMSACKGEETVHPYGVHGDASVLAVLDLLDDGAAPEDFEHLVRRARQQGASEEELARLEYAKERGLSIHAQLLHRRQRESGLAALVDTARDLSAPYDVDTILRIITRRARTLVGLDMAYISVPEPGSGTHYVRMSDGHVSSLNIGLRLPSTEGGLGSVVLSSGMPNWSPDYLTDDRFQHSRTIDEVVRAENLHAILAVPMFHNGRPQGVLYVGDRSVRRFTPDEVSLMSSLGDLSGVAIATSQLLHDVTAEVNELEHDTSRAREGLNTVQELSATHSRLIDLVLGGCDLEELAAEGSALLGGELRLVAPDGAVLAEGAAPAGAPGDGRRREAGEGEIERAVLETASSPGAPVRTGSSSWAVSIHAGVEHLGILLLHGSTELTDKERQLLSFVAQACAVSLQLQSSAAAVEGRVRDELCAELLAAPDPVPRHLAERARRLAFDLEKPYVVVVARPEQAMQGKAAIWAVSYARRKTGLSSVRDDCVVLILPGPEASTIAQSVSQELRAALRCPVTVGAGGPMRGVDAVSRAYREALRCVEAITALGGSGRAASVSELGFLGVLLSETKNAGGFVDSVLGPVLEHDKARSTELLLTLEKYFSTGCSPTRAAEQLHVHPNTVSRRLERITELLGEEWATPEQALEAQLALRLHRTRHLLTGRSEPGSAP